MKLSRATTLRVCTQFGMAMALRSRLVRLRSQIVNVGAERMLGYTAADVMNTITPADISDPQEVIVALSANAIPRDIRKGLEQEARLGK